MNRKLLIPLAVFGVVFAFLLVGLGLNPREVPSPLIGKPAPQFQLKRLHDPAQAFGTADMKGKVWLLNVWASWCVACREEHPLLVELARAKIVPIVGLDYKDDPAAGIQWLRQHGDPYDLSVVDRDGAVGIDYGVYGVPETFLIDKAGVIRYKHIGPVTAQALEKKIIPLVRELQKS
ncbi:MAG: DsbE family thiol:disulfide interchange protein [Betaproteobacteria bacterium]|nr:DsbE family thiol:disulfide interchange protein [Betaproteobacteria bacterium]